jgi:predicted TPR repeat methyltransferase
MTNGFLDKAYGARDAQSTRQLYDDWAASYESEISENGYATPGRCAAALRAVTTDLTKPILDFGCGTGLSGLALKLAGFEVIDGLDLSPEMLEQAKAKGIYRKTELVEPGAALAHSPGDYGAIAAIGVIGAAPLSVFHLLMKGLAPDNKLVLSLNDHALADPSYEAAMSEWLDCGAARLLFKEHGDHLPGINLKSTVYVIEKA